MNLESLNVVINLLSTLINLGIISEADKAKVKNHLLDEILNASDGRETKA